MLQFKKKKKKKGIYLRSDDCGLTDTTESGDKKRRGRLTHLKRAEGESREISVNKEHDTRNAGSQLEPELRDPS